MYTQYTYILVLQNDDFFIIDDLQKDIKLSNENLI